MFEKLIPNCCSKPLRAVTRNSWTAGPKGIPSVSVAAHSCVNSVSERIRSRFTSFGGGPQSEHRMDVDEAAIEGPCEQLFDGCQGSIGPDRGVRFDHVVKNVDDIGALDVPEGLSPENFRNQQHS